MHRMTPNQKRQRACEYCLHFEGLLRCHLDRCCLEPGEVDRDPYFHALLTQASFEDLSVLSLRTRSI